VSDLTNLAPALVAALTDLTNVAKGHKANTGSYGYSFLNIADLVAETRPVLARHGLVALTPVHEHGSELACTVVLLHSSGERLDFGPFPFPQGRDAQSTGSWVTYIRRYALLAALGMGAEDDDGASAKAKERHQPRQEQPSEPPPGEPVAQVKNRVKELVAGKVTPGTEVDHALAIWQQAKVTEVRHAGAKFVTAEDVDVVMRTAAAYLADLEAVNA